MECTQPWKGRNSLAQGAALGYEETTLSPEGAQYFFTEPNPAIMLRPFRAYLNIMHSPRAVFWAKVSRRYQGWILTCLLTQGFILC